MKKLLCALTALTLLLTAFVLAEAADRSTDAGASDFAGRWGCERATIDIFAHDDDTFRVVISWGSSAAENVEWNYTCAYDADDGCLRTVAPGSKAVVTYSEGGSIASTATEYADGEAAFRIDADGMLIWDDAKENAGAGMRFERGIELTPAIEGEWQVNDEVMAGLTIAPNADGGWAAELRLVWPETRVMKANLAYDREHNQFTYTDGTFYEYEIHNTPEGEIGDVVADGVEGSLKVAAGESGEIELEWTNGQEPGPTARFHRPEGWDE